MCLVWLLLIALPLQGFASATMFSCGTESTHHAPDTVAAARGEADAPKSAGHCDPSQNGQPGAAAPADAPADSSFHDCKNSCNACQACCVGAVLVSGFSVWKPAAVATELPSASPQVFASGHIPGGLERPPRLPIA
ncbi:hypothetical protein C7C56_010120 [Massilia glaciei]|uniref:Uncharacterized protein n=2 Tax=Massilia glaciei TaxID=1524097 RepID=A0A2U2HMX3_9BURK|nr:hypothetical protein C7C56_010120 [Massilia glaciei]